MSDLGAIRQQLDLKRRLEQQEVLEFPTSRTIKVMWNSAAMFNSAGGLVLVQNHAGLQFTDGLTHYADFNIKLPVLYAGTTPTVTFSWAPSTNGAGNVKLDLEFRRRQSATTLSVAATASSATTIFAAPAVQYQHTISTTTIALTAFAEGDHLSFRLIRRGADAADTFAGNFILFDVTLSI